MRTNFLCRFACAAICVFSMPCMAQNPTDVFLNTQESPCFHLFEIELDSGKDPLPQHLSESLQYTTSGQADSAQFRCIGADGIQILIDRVQNALIAQGYVTSRVLAEPQNLLAGKLKLKVFLGRIHQIKWPAQTDGQPRRATSFNTLPLNEGDVLNLKDIEQGLDNFKRVPTVEADIQIAPADQAGLSDLLITHRQSKLFRFNLTWDDSGTPSTGKQQASVTISYDNWLTLSDLFYVTVNQDTGEDKDPGYRGTHGKAFHYSVPMGYQLLAFNLSNSSYYQTVAGSTTNYVYAGTSENADIKISRVIHRDAVSKTTMGLKAFRRQSNNYTDDLEIVVQKRIVGGWVWDIGHRHAIDQMTVEGNLAYKQGTNNFGAIAAPEEKNNTGTSRMRIWNADFSLNKPFNLFGKSFEYGLNGRYQYNLNRLTQQDYFSIAGRSTVRGFDGLNTLSSDRGWLVRHDLSTDLAAGHKIFIGLDRGAVSGPASETLIGKSLSGAVLGLRGQKDALQYEFFAGGPLDKPDRFKTSKTTTGFNLSLSF